MIRQLLLPLLAAGPLAAQPAVIADLPVTAGLAGAVLGGEVPSLLGPTDDPHHASLRPSQARALADADLVVRMGGGLSPWLDDAASALSGGILVLDPPEEDHAAHEEHADHAEGHEDHQHGPHAWLDPSVVALWLGQIAGNLSTLDPEGAEAFEARKAEAQGAVGDAVDAARAHLAEVPAGPILMVHDAWGAAAEAFGLDLVGAVSDSDAEKPGARHLSEIEALLSNGGVSCLLAAPGDDLTQAQRLSETHDLPMVTLPLTGAPEAEGIAVYTDLVAAIGALGESCPPL